MRTENLHLTLAFIGELSDADAGRVAAACAREPTSHCDWQLDRIGLFVRPRVLWAGGEATDELDAIARHARSLLDLLGIDFDRKPFVPHVTLLRDVRGYDGPRTLAPPIAWPITELALYRSGRDRSGARYFRVEAV